MKIEALHEFHDPAFSQGWSDRFTPSPERLRLFQTMLEQMNLDKKDTVAVLELGIGPGYLAHYLLGQSPIIQYEGLDFSLPMLDIAYKRNADFEDRISFTQADLVKDQWGDNLTRQPEIIVSTWALHDLFSKENIFSVYQAAYEVLPKGGILLNGDFIKPETSPYEYESGRIKPSEHIDLLLKAGFQTAVCVAEFEKSVDQPTTANNYSCFRAEK